MRRFIGVEHWRLCHGWYLDEKHGKNTVLWLRLHLAIPLADHPLDRPKYRFFGIGNGLSSDRAVAAATSQQQASGFATPNTTSCVAVYRTQDLVFEASEAACLSW